MDTDVVTAGNLQGTKIHVKLSSEMEEEMLSSRTVIGPKSEAVFPNLEPPRELVRNIVGDYIFKQTWSNGAKLYEKEGYNLFIRADGKIHINSTELAPEGITSLLYHSRVDTPFLKPGDIIVGPPIREQEPDEHDESSMSQPAGDDSQGPKVTLAGRPLEQEPVQVEEGPAEPEEKRWMLPTLNSNVYLLIGDQKTFQAAKRVTIGRYYGSTEDDAKNTEVLMHPDGILQRTGQNASVVRGGVLQDGNAIIPFTKMTMSEPKASASWRVIGKRQWPEGQDPVTYQLKLDIEFYGELIQEAGRNPVVAYAGGPLGTRKIIIAFRGQEAARQQKAKFIADFRLLSDEWTTIFVLGDGMTGGGKKSTRRTKKRRTKKRRTKKRRTKKRRNTKRRTRRR